MPKVVDIQTKFREKEVKEMSDQELNIWLAENLFDFEWWKSSSTGRRGLFPPYYHPEWFKERADMTEGLCADHPSHVPDYCSEKDVWRVIEKCKERGIFFLIQTNNNCVLVYQQEEKEAFGTGMDILNFGEFADKLPRSICQAVLVAFAELEYRELAKPPVFNPEFLKQKEKPEPPKAA